jgi:glutathione S-transferase
MIKLYGISASRAARCLWMLEELGVPYENVPTSFIGDTKKPEYLALNPNGHIPTLDDDGLVLWESMAINLHLARKYGAKAGLWPAADADQSRTVMWSIWGMTEIEPPALKVLMNRVFLPEAQRSADAAAEGERELQKPLGVLEGALAKTPYLLGQSFTAADLNVHSILQWATTWGRCDVSGVPKTAAWLARCGERPALARATQGV